MMKFTLAQRVPTPPGAAADFVVEPEAGTALLFLHDTWHEGAALVEGTKYVLRSDVLYAPPESSPS